MQTIFNACILVFVFIFLPAYTKTPYGDNLSVEIFFLIQIGYIVASSKQIRYGYPTSDTYIASMIDSSYSILNRCIFFVCSSRKCAFILLDHPVWLLMITSYIVTFPSSSKFTRFLIGHFRQPLSTLFTGLKCIAPIPFFMIVNAEY